MQKLASSIANLQLLVQKVKSLKVDVIFYYAFDFKGYLRYEVVTPQNVLSEARVKNFFISYKSYVPFSR